ncbi:MAG: C39 family peptidase, partial [Cyanobacteria bacterium J06636_28]
KVEAYGDTTDHGAQTNALSGLGVKSEWHTTLTMEDVKAELNAGRPVVLGVLHKGHVSSPRGGGHMILAVGYDDTGMFIHDPYGDMDLVNGGYPGSTDGAFRHYSYKNLGARFEVDGPSTGWGRIFKGSRA